MGSNLLDSDRSLSMTRLLSSNMLICQRFIGSNDTDIFQRKIGEVKGEELKSIKRKKENMT